MKKVFLLLFLTLFTILSLSSCSLLEDKEKAQQAKDESRTVFLDSLKEKYGFTADIEEVEAEYTSLFPSFTGKVNITASYNGKTFYAYVEDGNVYDNYQASEVYDAMVEYILNLLELPEPMILKFDNNNRDSFEADLYLSIYYDGTNIEKCFNYISPSIDMVFETGITFKDDLSESVKTAFRNVNSMWMRITILEKNSLSELTGIDDYLRMSSYYAPYVDQIISYKKNDADGFTETIENYELGRLTDYGIDELDSVLVLKTKESENLQFEKGVPVEGWELKSNEVQIIDSYNISYDYALDLYFPLDKIKEWFDDYSEVYLILHNKDKTAVYQYPRSDLDWRNNSTRYYGQYYHYIVSTAYDYFTIVGIPE